MNATKPKRFAPEIPFPPYAYIPGLNPHPARDLKEAEEESGEAIALVTPLDPNHWDKNTLYLYGIDLFNYGYYWETHEAWEDLWHAAGRKGITATFLQALIHMAAAGVKMKSGDGLAMQKHGKRAHHLFAEIRFALLKEQDYYMGLSIIDLLRWSEEIGEISLDRSTSVSPESSRRLHFFLIPEI